MFAGVLVCLVAHPTRLTSKRHIHAHPARRSNDAVQLLQLMLFTDGVRLESSCTSDVSMEALRGDDVVRAVTPLTVPSTTTSPLRPRICSSAVRAAGDGTTSLLLLLSTGADAALPWSSPPGRDVIVGTLCSLCDCSASPSVQMLLP